MPKMRRTVFNEQWLLLPEFSGIMKGNVKTEAFCSVCNKTLQLSNRGIEALKSHIKQGSKHAKKVLLMKNTPNIRLFTNNNNNEVCILILIK